MLNGRDVDEPPDPDDDFSGEEPFQADGRSVDQCGEPLSFSLDATLSDGQLEAHLNYYAVEGMALGGDVQLLGSVERGGAAARFFLCGYGTARSLGATGLEGSTWLEAVAAGGAAFGMPALPGVAPDIDLDGDGGEQFVLDEDGRLSSCVDGDGAIIDGRDCWQDPRIADGYSVTFVLSAVPARFVGLARYWQAESVVPCDEPPDRSFWDYR
jgi:hypothetical protein